MNVVTRKIELLSIALLGAAFFVFTIAIPLMQNSIDTINAYYSDYKFNLQQSSLKHGKFISAYDNAHFLDILLQEKIITDQQIKATLRIQDRLGLRCQHLIADAIMSASVDPSDESDDTISRHTRLRQTNLDDLIKEWDKYVGPSPTRIGHKFVEELRTKNRWKLFLYSLGSIFFIVGTFLQFASKRGGANKPMLPNENTFKKDEKNRKRKRA